MYQRKQFFLPLEFVATLGALAAILKQWGSSEDKCQHTEDDREGWKKSGLLMTLLSHLVVQH